MGYYTKFTLEYKLPEEFDMPKEHEEFINECEKKGIKIPLALKEVIDDKHNYHNELIRYMESEESTQGYGPIIDLLHERWDDCKWYDHEQDMRKMSSLFPSTLFTLKGVGENQPDLWVKYFMYGMIQRCEAQITFEEFDTKKLS